MDIFELLARVPVLDGPDRWPDFERRIKSWITLSGLSIVNRPLEKPDEPGNNTSEEDELEYDY